MRPIYMCVSVDITMPISRLLWRERISSIAQDWHIWYYYQWVQPQLLTPFWMCWRSAHWFRISILCILVCELFLLYFFIYIFIEKSLQWIGGSSNSFVCNLVEKVSDQVKEQLENLEEVAEGDAQPEGETAAQGVEQTPVLSKDNTETSTKNITLKFLPSCFTLKS